jgi:hypothetical protein
MFRGVGRLAYKRIECSVPAGFPYELLVGIITAYGSGHVLSGSQLPEISDFSGLGGIFPSEIRIFSAKMPIGSGL